MASLPRSYRMTARADDMARTRERVLDAAAARFLAQPYDEVRVADIAADAGVSPQTLHNHFVSKERLLVAAAEVMGRQALGLRGDPAPGDVGAVVRGLVREYERLGDATVRLVALQDRIAVVAEVVAGARAEQTAWLRQKFTDALRDDDRGRRLTALYAATDVGTWKLVRRDLGRSRADTTAVMESLVRAVVEARQPT